MIPPPARKVFMPQRLRDYGGGSVPVPDPTILTTQQLVREIDALKEVIFTRLDGMDEAIKIFNEAITRTPTDTDKQIQHLKSLHETRFDGMDKAVWLLQSIGDKLPGIIDEKIHSLKDLHEEKFSSIEKQFKERDVRTEQSSKDSKVAVDAALQAAKEAVGAQNTSSALAIAKSETATMKQIDQISMLIQTGNKAVDDKFDDLKERLTRIEGKGEGKVVTEAAHQTSSTFVVSVVMAIIAFVSLAAWIFMSTRGVSH